jgi:hypothetical protein
MFVIHTSLCGAQRGRERFSTCASFGVLQGVSWTFSFVSMIKGYISAIKRNDEKLYYVLVPFVRIFFPEDKMFSILHAKEGNMWPDTPNEITIGKTLTYIVFWIISSTNIVLFLWKECCFYGSKICKIIFYINVFYKSCP